MELDFRDNTICIAGSGRRKRSQCNHCKCTSVRWRITNKSSSTRCFITKVGVKKLGYLKQTLSRSEWRWFETHAQFKHFFQMPQEKSHKVMEMWMLLLRTFCTKKKRSLVRGEWDSHSVFS